MSKSIHQMSVSETPPPCELKLVFASICATLNLFFYNFLQPSAPVCLFTSASFHSHPFFDAAPSCCSRIIVPPTEPSSSFTLPTGMFYTSGRKLNKQVEMKCKKKRRGRSQINGCIYLKMILLRLCDRYFLKESKFIPKITATEDIEREEENSRRFCRSLKVAFPHRVVMHV